MNPPLPLAARLLALPRDALLLLVRGYRLLLKPWLGNACRFEPTCSAYALQALQTHGALKGSALSGWRLLRCHPWCDGGFDPPPAHFSLFGRRHRGPAEGLFTGLVDNAAAHCPGQPCASGAGAQPAALASTPSVSPVAPVSPRTPT